jgi:RNase P/RNase MRP subunit p30
VWCSGAENAADIRGPFDVINMGQLLNLSAEQVRCCLQRLILKAVRRSSIETHLTCVITGQVGHNKEL